MDLEYEDLKHGMIVRGALSREIIKIKKVNKEVTSIYLDTGHSSKLDSESSFCYELPHINPKFKVGDVVKYNGGGFEHLITDINEEYYVTRHNGSIIYGILFEHEHLMKKIDKPIGVVRNLFPAAYCGVDFGYNEANNHFKNTEEKMNTELRKTKLTEAQKKFLPADVQKLVELGVLDRGLQVTPPGSILLTNLQIKDDKTRQALIEMAEAVQKKDEDKEVDEE